MGKRRCSVLQANYSLLRRRKCKVKTVRNWTTKQRKQQIFNILDILVAVVLSQYAGICRGEIIVLVESVGGNGGECSHHLHKLEIIDTAFSS